MTSRYPNSWTPGTPDPETGELVGAQYPSDRVVAEIDGSGTTWTATITENVDKPDARSIEIVDAGSSEQVTRSALHKARQYFPDSELRAALENVVEPYDDFSEIASALEALATSGDTARVTTKDGKEYRGTVETVNHPGETFVKLTNTRLDREIVLRFAEIRSAVAA